MPDDGRTRRVAEVARSFDMDTLRSLVALVELGGLAPASRRVGRTQAALSLQMKRLEARAGRPLFHRDSRRLVLTDAGEFVLGYARRILALNDEALQMLGGARLSGAVRFGSSQDFGEAWLPPVLAQFRRAYPSVSLEVRIDGGSRSLQALDGGELDLVLALGLGERGRCVRIGELPLVWIAHRDFAWDRSRPLPLAVFTSPCRFRNRGTSALDSVGVPWTIGLTSPSLYGVWAAVSAGLGVTIRTPEGLQPELEIVDDKFGLPRLGSVDITLYFGSGTRSAAVETLAGLLRERLDGRLAELRRRSRARRTRERASREAA